MRAAFSIWEERIAPVFDVAAQVVLVEEDSGDSDAVWIPLPSRSAEAVVSELVGLGVSVLVCGAVSWPLHDTLVRRGIKVHPFVAGELADVVQAWRDRRLDEARFLMPGCGGTPGVGRFGARHRFRRRGADLPYGAPVTPAGRVLCRCPLCGNTIMHVPGEPCSEQCCPHCHAPMVRA